MRILCAPDSFKESLTAAEAARAMARGVRKAAPQAQAEECPIADGGEGTVDAMLAATRGTQRLTRVAGPLNQPVQARWGLLGTQPHQPRTAVIEMAAASGLPRVPPHQRDPTRTTTFGTGELIRAALDEQARRIILGIGGSATCDGGCGAAQALGARFLDSHGQIIQEPITGGMLQRIAQIDLSTLDDRLRRAELVVACDVTNPLTGPDGAAYVYGPQKGATPQQVRLLDEGLAHLASLVEQATGQQLHLTPGAGAAGGLGYGAMAFLGGKLRRGIELVLDAVDLERRVRGCDLCLTGEGRLDGQSLSGKAILGVAQAAARQGVPTVALVGSLGPDAQRCLQAGLEGYIVIGEGLSQEESIARAASLLEDAAARLIAQRFGHRAR